MKPPATAKRRLAALLEPLALRDLVWATAARVIAACLSAGTDAIVVAGDGEVASWAADLGVLAIPDPGGGLDGAAAAGTAMAAIEGRPWIVVHADLPLLGAGDVAAVLDSLAPGTVVLAPARDGGTNLVAASAPLEFRYGPGSFSRHLRAAAALDRRIVTRIGTLVEIDTPADLRGAAALPGGRWLRPYLG